MVLVGMSQINMASNQFKQVSQTVLPSLSRASLNKIHDFFDWQVILIAIVTWFILTMLVRFGLFQELLDLSRLLVNPFEQKVGGVLHWTAGRAAPAARVWQAAERSARIESEYINLQAQLGELSLLRDENERLKRQLGQINNTIEARYIVSPVISYPYRLLGVGKTQGVSVGDLVLANRILLGIIDQVFTNSSTIILLADSVSQPIVVKTESGVVGLLKNISGQLVITEIRQELKIVPGERVVSVGQEGIDANIMIGITAEEITRSTDSVQTYKVEQGITFETADVVYIR